MARIKQIYTCPDKGLPMESHIIITAKKGIGLEGDRYALGKGSWSKSKTEKIRHVSLIAMEAIDEANKELGIPFTPFETRRNLITEGIDLNSLVNKKFMVGEVLMEGVELCDPCTRPSVLLKKKGFETAFLNRGGLRAEIITDGRICIGDIIVS